MRSFEPAGIERRIKNETSQIRLSRGTPVEQPSPESAAGTSRAAMGNPRIAIGSLGNLDGPRRGPPTGRGPGAVSGEVALIRKKRGCYSQGFDLSGLHLGKNSTGRRAYFLTRTEISQARRSKSA